MKFEEFIELTLKWSYEDMVRYIMENTIWCDRIIALIKSAWEEEEHITIEELNRFGKKNGYGTQETLPLGD